MKQRHKDISLRTKPESYQKKTGKTLEEWFGIIDGFKGAEIGHAAIAKRLQTEFDVDAWWAQSITVAYEYKKGLRKPNQRKNGFEFSVQRTLPKPIEAVYELFTDEEKVGKWLSPYVEIELRVGGKFNFDDVARLTFVKIVPYKLLRLEMLLLADDALSRVDFEFLAKGKQKTTIKITNARLRSQNEVTVNRPYWSSILDTFAAYAKKHL